MAEIGAGGGAQMVDPRNVREVINAMRQLLTDHERYSKLQAEAQRRVGGSWDDYAAQSWDWLTGRHGTDNSP
jgi:glycosyltransferase involved in cell wall biosynthesis